MSRRLEIRLIRLVFNLAAGLSLLLCVTTFALWLRSGWRSEYVEFSGPARDVPRAQPVLYARTFKAGSNGGVLWLEWWPPQKVYHQPWYRPGWYYQVESSAASTGDALRSLFTGEYWWSWNRPWSENLDLLADGGPSTFRVSWLAYLLVFAILPGIWLLRWRGKRRRRRLGLCDACGYDLRQSPERCPECGAVNPRRLVATPANPPAEITSS